MADVDVLVMTPDEKIFKATIDANADEKELVEDLIHWLKLPVIDKHTGEPIEYTVSLIGGTKIREGARLRLHQVHHRPVKKIVPYNDEDGEKWFE